MIEETQDQTSTPGSITRYLLEWRQGNPESLNRLIPLVERELRRMAHRYLRSERRGHTLETTALVNEAYLKLVNLGQVDWKGRAHFLAMAARAMRRILVDYARGAGADKRRGVLYKLPLDERLIFSTARSAQLIALDDALNALGKRDPRKVQVVELRYFGGLSVEESAEALGVHAKTVMRDWNFARVWLKRELGVRKDE